MIIKRKRRLLSFTLIGMTIAILFIIVHHIQSSTMNYYHQTVISNITVSRNEHQRTFNIRVISILSSRSDVDEYRLAIDSIICYTNHHNYSFTLVILEENSTLARLCPQNDVCVIDIFLENNFAKTLPFMLILVYVSTTLHCC